MAGVQASAVLRAGRWLLPLTIPVCCVVWMLLVFSPPTPELDAGHRQSFHVSVGENVGAMERRGTPPGGRAWRCRTRVTAAAGASSENKNATVVAASGAGERRDH